MPYILELLATPCYGVDFSNTLFRIHSGRRPHNWRLAASNTMEAELTRLDATELAELIRSRKVSSFDIVQAHLERIAAVDPKTNAIVTLNNNALEAAKAADAAVLSGEESLGPLHGVPFTGQRFH